MNNDTRRNAVGKWRTILSHFGFTEKELSGKHGPCPMCEGTDRFRYTDYKNNGDYFCSSCGAGSGFDLLMKKFGMPFAEAAKEVDKILGNGDIEPVFNPEINVEKRRTSMNKVWRGADSQFILSEYLTARGIVMTPLAYIPDLRGHRALWNYEGGLRGPAMVALIRNKAGEPISIHRTYINLNQRKIMPPTETIKGAAVRLGKTSPDFRLVIGEGIETTLSGMEHFGCPGYAAISAYGMEEIIIPESITSVIILADNDRSFTGQKAAFTLARRMDREKRKVRVVMPTHAGMDFNDFEAFVVIAGWDNGRT